MNITDAHNLINPEINEILEHMEYYKYGIGFMQCRYAIIGILSSQERELEFLEDESDIIQNTTKIKERIEALKISNADLKEKLK